jgi:hypothetical protein
MLRKRLAPFEKRPDRTSQVIRPRSVLLRAILVPRQELRAFWSRRSWGRPVVRRPPGERAERVDLVERSVNETLRPAVPTHASNALIVTAITAARSMRAYTPRTFTKPNGAAPCRPPTPSTVN